METRLLPGVGGPVVPASMENINHGTVHGANEGPVLVENEGPGISVPMVNEMAAVVIGRALSDPGARPELEEAMLKSLASVDNLEVVYKQNTADELNIVVPDFPDFSTALRKLKENELAAIHGGEIFGALSGMTLSWIGCQVGIGLIFGTGLTLGGTVIGATSAATFAGALVVAGMLAMPSGLGVIGATVASGIGVGIAAGLGAFNTSDDNAVNIAVAS